MNGLFYIKLAKTNLKKNSKTYFPYILTCICSIIMFYVMNSLSLNKGLNNIRGRDGLITILGFGDIIIAIFSVIFLFYTNSFLIKRRKKEIGLYNVLGMEKKHIGKILSIETLIIAFISLILGVLGGILMEKLLYLILLNLLKMKITFSSTVSISMPSIVRTIELFSAIFIVILMANILQVKVTNPIELLKGGQKGEKEPKTSWILSILGVIELAVGYGMALTIDSPLNSLDVFFIAVILVMVGTYSTFTAGSIAFLKLLKKNKSFFYKTKNFISVSGMIYRMKQNAVGLANICILSTAVLITVSTTAALYYGQESSLKIAYPLDADISIENVTDAEKNEVINLVQEEAKKKNVTLKNKIQYYNKKLLVEGEKNSFKTPKIKQGFFENITEIEAYTLEDYNKMESKNVSLKENEVLIFSVVKDFQYDSIIINGLEYKIKDQVNKLKIVNKNKNNIRDKYVVIVKDMKTLNDICKTNKDEKSKMLDYNIFFDISGDKENIIQFSDSLKSSICTGKHHIFRSIYTKRENFYVTNGGFIFIGSFLGLLFTMGTVLIIYYKQITEGYEDSERFRIMQNVGMSKEEVKKTINKQVLMVFFLPLIVSTIHIAVAFKVVSKLLALFGLFDVTTLIIAVAVAVLVFSVLYTVVYALTANTYYKILQQEN
ncbi:FtsX-like permease family protein [Haloimpatiens sp. FM7315]|uniref:ABC transporter permease n=1 Tax=Haloimpatiens sp. FM7315 TaxID=3298609 RepID=UPI0039774C25